MLAPCPPPRGSMNSSHGRGTLRRDTSRCDLASDSEKRDTADDAREYARASFRLLLIRSRKYASRGWSILPFFVSVCTYRSRALVSCTSFQPKGNGACKASRTLSSRGNSFRTSTLRNSAISRSSSGVSGASFKRSCVLSIPRALCMKSHPR